MRPAIPVVIDVASLHDDRLAGQHTTEPDQVNGPYFYLENKKLEPLTG